MTLKLSQRGKWVQSARFKTSKMPQIGMKVHLWPEIRQDRHARSACTHKAGSSCKIGMWSHSDRRQEEEEERSANQRRPANTHHRQEIAPAMKPVIHSCIHSINQYFIDACIHTIMRSYNHSFIQLFIYEDSRLDARTHGGMIWTWHARTTQDQHAGPCSKGRPRSEAKRAHRQQRNKGGDSQPQ